jgi:predicted PurR-regulated permease PerM
MGSDWRRALVVLSSVAVAAAVVGLLYWARTVIIPVALSVLIAFILSPMVTRLQHRGLGRALAVSATIGLAILVFVGAASLVSHQVGQLADTLPDRRDAIKAKVAAAKRSIVGDGESRFGQLVDDVMAVIAPGPRPSEVVVAKPASASWTAQIETYLGPAAEILGQAVFTFFFVIFMLLKREDLRNRAIRLLGDGTVMTATKAVDDASQRISRYLLTQLMMNSAFGTVIAIGLFAIGVKYSLLWGFIAAVMRYVPYIGIWIGVIPPLLFSFTTSTEWGGIWGQPLAVLGLYIGFDAFCVNLIEPRLYGQSMGISEVAQLVSAAAWAFLWGPIGLILSGPLTVCLLVLGRHVTRFRFLVVLLGDEPPLKPQVAFYQRLLARDQDEAADVAIEAAKAMGPDAAFDSVFIPALCLARRDAGDGDLDRSDLRFIVDAVREIAEEIFEMREPKTDENGEPVRMLICPVRDKAESVAAELLALTLDSHRWNVKIVSDEMLASELIEQVAEFHPEVLLLATLPPGGLSHTKYLIARLRRHFPDLKLLIGRWGSDNETKTDRNDALRNTNGLDQTLAGTRKRLAELHPVLAVEEQRPAGSR